MTDREGPVERGGGRQWRTLWGGFPSAGWLAACAFNMQGPGWCHSAGLFEQTMPTPTEPHYYDNGLLPGR